MEYQEWLKKNNKTDSPESKREFEAQKKKTKPKSILGGRLEPQFMKKLNKAIGMEEEE